MDPGRRLLSRVAGGSLLSGLGLATRAGWAYASGWQRRLRGGAEPAGIFLLAVWFGLITGWGQAAVFLVKKEFQGRMIWKGIDYVWMIPLANLALFVVVGLVLEVLHRLWPRLVSMSTATFLLAWLAALGLFQPIPRVNPLALVVLAAGIAAQLAWLATRRSRGFSSLVRFTVGWPALLRRSRQAENRSSSAAAPAPVAQLPRSASPTRRQFLLGAAAGIATVAFGTRASLFDTERRARARLVRSASGMPNVLLIVLDTVRAQSMSLYGYSRPTTPNLERLATQGTLFARAIAPASWTLPSHASMFTGRFPYELSANWEVPLDSTYPTLAEILSKHGYVTAGFVANMPYCSRESGLSRGFAHYEDYRVTPEQAFLYTSFGAAAKDRLGLVERFGNYRNFGRKSAEQVNADFLSWLSREERRPFFAFLNYYDAHDPYLPPASFGLKFSATTPRGFVTDELANHLTAEAVRELRDGYDSLIAYLDQQVEALLDALGALNLASDTVVLITSDHGEQFGEHNLTTHGNSVYRYLIHVPLLFLWPGQLPAGMAVRQPVSLTDLPATMLDLAGIQPAPDMPGRSLARLWRNAAAEPQPAVYSENDMPFEISVAGIIKGRHRSLVSSEYHYILQPDGKEKLYSFEADPEEVTNLSETPAGRDAIGRLRPFLPRG
jgi:arylsulfatase A-like enzyme